MYAIFTMRKLHLTQRINNIQYKMMQLSQRLQDLSTYSSNIADGIITPSEFMNSPSSIYGVNMNFFNSSVPKALFEASQATQMYNAKMVQMHQASGGQYSMAVDPSNPNSIFNNQFFVFNSFFKQALDAAGKAEAAKIKRLETDIENQMKVLETQEKAATKELEAVEKAEDEGINRSTPKYA